MAEFFWEEWNREKVYGHNLSTDEVEAAWVGRVDYFRGVHPLHGPFTRSYAECPSGREIIIVWRYNEDDFGNEWVFVITAYGGGG